MIDPINGFTPSRTSVLLSDAKEMARAGYGYEDAFVELRKRGLLAEKDRDFFRQLFLSVAKLERER